LAQSRSYSRQRAVQHR